MLTGPLQVVQDELDQLIAVIKATFLAEHNDDGTHSSTLTPKTGSWVPTIGGTTSETGQTYSIRVGRYVRIGNLVWITGIAILTAKGTITGNITIKGLPFTADATPNLFHFPKYFFNNFTTPIVDISGTIAPGRNEASVKILTAAATSYTDAVTADIGDTTQISLTATYLAAE
mgnify:CR=1 FL=1